MNEKEMKYCFTGKDHLCCPFTDQDIQLMADCYPENTYYVEKKNHENPDICNGYCAKCKHPVILTDVAYSTKSYDTFKNRMLYKIGSYFSFFALFLVPYCIGTQICMDDWRVGIFLALITPIFFEIAHFEPFSFDEWKKMKYNEKIAAKFPNGNNC